MTRAIAAAIAVGLASAAWAELPPETYLPDVSLSQLNVVETSSEFALVETKDGTAAVLVRVGDTVGRDQFEVTRISKGCLWLVSRSETISLCVDAGASPRS